MIHAWLPVALGGALGSVARWWVSTLITLMAPAGLPLGTFAVNIIGSALFGFLFQCSMTLDAWRDPARLLLLTGLLGGFTTFSSFSFDTLRLLQEGRVAIALANVLMQLILGVFATWMGMLAGKQIFSIVP